MTTRMLMVFLSVAAFSAAHGSEKAESKKSPEATIVALQAELETIKTQLAKALEERDEAQKWNTILQKRIDKRDSGTHSFNIGS